MGFTMSQEIRLCYTKPNGKNVYSDTPEGAAWLRRQSRVVFDKDGLPSHMRTDSSGDTSTTEEYSMEDESTPEQCDPARCSHCGHSPVDYDEAERICRSECAAYIDQVGQALFTLETRKWLAKRAKLNGPESLQKKKSPKKKRAKADEIGNESD